MNASWIMEGVNILVAIVMVVINVIVIADILSIVMTTAVLVSMCTCFTFYKPSLQISMNVS